ncbi:MAG TPA: GNAT family N-acetyltransferase [Rhodospirillales bacterium]|nr:GNAT family N-acetyltransferase [Rhodospirillales bacterium]
MKFVVAETVEEWHEAFDLAAQVFTLHSAMEDYTDKKAKLWFEDPTHALNNLILAKTDTQKIVGLVRFIPRTFRGPDRTFSSVGFSSVCIAPALRGKGYSLPLMRFSIETADNRGFDFSFLIARKKLDHFYTKFGFWGVSSYNRVFVTSAPCIDGEVAIKFHPADPGCLSQFDQAYRKSYASTLGWMERDKRHWRFLLTVAQNLGMRFLSVVRDGNVIGYAVLNDHEVCEIALLDETEFQAVVNALNATFYDDAHKISCLVSAEHMLVGALSDQDLSINYRECPWGGHMVRLLRGTSMQSEDPSYADTLKWLGARSISRPTGNGGKLLPAFNFSLIDEI